MILLNIDAAKTFTLLFLDRNLETKRKLLVCAMLLFSSSQISSLNNALIFSSKIFC